MMTSLKPTRQISKKQYYNPCDSEEDSQDKECQSNSESESGESGCNEIVSTVEKLSAMGRHTRKRRRPRKRPISICTANCRYEVVRRVAYRYGMREVPEDGSWNLCWTDLSISVERCKDMKRFQKINHFPGMSEICRKDLLARNLNRMLKLYPEEYSFFPKSWCLPADMADVVAYSRAHKNKTYLLKPDVGCQGKGIIITKSVKEVRPQERMICQLYITRPFLIDGFKFDLRMYTLITSCDPLRIFVYNEGLVRLATSRYREPTGGNAGNIYMHLTNYAVNKHNRMYIVDDELGSKRKISTLNRWLLQRGYHVPTIWAAVDDVIIKTVIAAYPMLKHNYKTCFPTHDYTYACFELLGFDIILDENLKPFVLEVNHSPSFHTDTQIDRDIKEKLLHDTFEMLNLRQCDKKKIIEEDRRRAQRRLLKTIYKEQNSGDMENDPQGPLALQTEWEENHRGNFRRVYPCEGCEKYEKLFNQNSSSLFQDTAASRAREEASRVQRQETLSKAKQEAARRAGGRLLLEKLRPESPSRARTEAGKPSLRRLRQLQLAKSLSNSFDPSDIVEAEEMERQYQLRQREFLLKSYGLIEQIYQYLKQNRILRPDDELKYGSFGGPSTQTMDHLFQIPKASEPVTSIVPTTTKTNLVKSSSGSAEKLNISSSNSIVGYDRKGLCIKSNEAQMWMRPIPRDKWPFLPSTGLNMTNLPALPPTTDVRSTKAQVARTFSNKDKLLQLQRRERRPTVPPAL